jgi:hypothetical protein
MSIVTQEDYQILGFPEIPKIPPGPNIIYIREKHFKPVIYVHEGIKYWLMEDAIVYAAVNKNGSINIQIPMQDFNSIEFKPVNETFGNKTKMMFKKLYIPCFTERFEDGKLYTLNAYGLFSYGHGEYETRTVVDIPGTLCMKRVEKPIVMDKTSFIIQHPFLFTVMNQFHKVTYSAVVERPENPWTRQQEKYFFANGMGHLVHEAHHPHGGSHSHRH